MSIPQLIFVVPYRDREQHQIFFAKQMKTVLEDLPDDSYKIYYIHQCDTRSFNRGAMKNIGFLVIKQLYPNDYKYITIIFNDVDTVPFNKIFNWSFKGFRNMYHFTQIWGVLGFLKNNFCLAQLISGKQHIIICLGGGPTLNTEFKLLKDSNQMENLIIYVDNTLTRKYSAESTSLSDQWFADHKLNFVKLQ